MSEIYGSPLNFGGGGITADDIVDNLVSEATDRALSARQGKVLNTKKIEKVTGATSGNVPVFDSEGGLVDSGFIPSGKAVIGLVAKTTVFNADGSITETGSGYTKVTVFNSDGSIVDTVTFADTSVQHHRTVFNSDGSITETVY